MGLNLQLQALSLPSGAEFEGTRQLLQNSIAKYMAITGEENFNGINFGPTTPLSADQDKPWFKTDGSFHAIGWFAWSGSAWTPSPLIPQYGTFSAAPTGTSPGQLYYATDINRQCQWNGSAWVTADGGQGEVRFVRGTNITTILTNNPGWAQVTDAAATVLGVAGDGTANGWSNRSPETHLGEEQHTQTLDELVEHGHTADVNNPAGVAGAQAGSNSAIKQDTTITTSLVGGGLPFNVMQPTWFLYAIQKL